MLFPNPTLIDLSKFVKRGNHALVMIISIVVISQRISADNFHHCLPCDDFNRQSKMKCATSYEDCGDCKTGFIQDEEDWRICYAVEILDGPGKDIVQKTGDEVILPCRFNTKIWCLWTKNKKQMDIGSGSRYEYLSPDAGKTKSDDCSIIIQHLSMEDIGQWQCQSMADENLESVKGQPIQIFIKHDEDTLIPTITLNNMNISGQEIYMSDLQEITRYFRDTAEQTKMLECHVALRPSDLRWQINGNVILGGNLNDNWNRIQFDQNHLRMAIETYMTPVINLTCQVRYDNGQILTSYVIIHAQHQSDFNEQSRWTIQFQESIGKNQLPEVSLQKPLSYCIMNVYSKPYQISMAMIITILYITLVIIILVIIITIVYKKTTSDNKVHPIQETEKLNSPNDSNTDSGQQSGMDLDCIAMLQS